MRKKCLFLIISLLTSIMTYANDYEVYVNGSSLEPAEADDVNIEVKEEILTIRLGDDDKAYVDVDYTFYNHGEKTDMLVAFVANFPYNVGPAIDSINLFDGSPYIHDFTVEMNGDSLPVKTFVKDLPQNFKPELLVYDYGDFIYNGKHLWQYLYTFHAIFVKGENKIHHTYSYDLLPSNFSLWNLEYELSPASHWKGGKIGKFTLRVECPNTAKHFRVDCEDLNGTYPIFTKGVGKYKHDTWYCEPEKSLTISMRDAVAQWTMYNYSPKKRLDIYAVASTYNLDIYNDFMTADCHINVPYGYTYDRNPRFEPIDGNLKGQSRILRNIPYAHRGYIFKTKSMKKVFEKLWWYIPDSTYVPDMSDFTKKEIEFINGTYKTEHEDLIYPVSRIPITIYVDKDKLEEEIR